MDRSGIVVQSDAEHELSRQYPPGTRVTYMDPRDDGSEEMVLASGVVNGECLITEVSRQVLDSAGNVTGLEPYALGYVPVWTERDTGEPRSVLVAVPNVVESVKP